MRQTGSPPPKKVQPPGRFLSAPFLVLGWVAREGCLQLGGEL